MKTEVLRYLVVSNEFLLVCKGEKDRMSWAHFNNGIQPLKPYPHGGGTDSFLHRRDDVIALVMKVSQNLVENRLHVNVMICQGLFVSICLV